MPHNFYIMDYNTERANEAGNAPVFHSQEEQDAAELKLEIEIAADKARRKKGTLPEVEACDYEIAHGKPPRGQGYWAFAKQRTTPGINNPIFWINAPYSEAKKAAREHFRGVPVIYTLA